MPESVRSFDHSIYYQTAIEETAAAYLEKGVDDWTFKTGRRTQPSMMKEWLLTPFCNHALASSIGSTATRSRPHEPAARLSLRPPRCSPRKTRFLSVWRRRQVASPHQRCWRRVAYALGDDFNALLKGDIGPEH